MNAIKPQVPVLAVVYDGQCGLCTQSVRLIRQLDRRSVLEYVDAQDRAAVTNRWPSLDLDAILGQIHVITPEGRVYIGYNGVRQVAGVLPRVRLIAPLMGWPGIAWVGDKVYRWVAAHRYQFNRVIGKADICADGTCALPVVRDR
jgi:predicted DCC family thiol-disulfide oxidoreductase YuxK